MVDRQRPPCRCIEAGLLSIRRLGVKRVRATNLLTDEPSLARRRLSSEAWIQGVSPSVSFPGPLCGPGTQADFARKVDDLVQAMGISGISKKTPNQITPA